jgi:adenosylmethionine-8-amino-7-oxononanoate aminotransferase
MGLSLVVHHGSRRDLAPDGADMPAWTSLSDVVETVKKSPFVEQGDWVRNFKDVVDRLPPLVISDEELDSLTRAVGSFQ